MLKRLFSEVVSDNWLAAFQLEDENTAVRKALQLGKMMCFKFIVSNIHICT